MSNFTDNITGVVLAGGQGRRMGGRDKGLVTLAGRLMIEHVITRLEPQVGSLVISANRNIEAYRALGFPVVSDADSGFLGPLAGFLAAMRMADTPFILTSPCDTPLVCVDLAERLWRGLTEADAEIAVPHDGSYLQTVFALISTSLADSLENYLSEGGRKIDRWYETRRMATVDFSDARDTFINVNDADQHAEMEAKMASTR